MIHYNAWFRFKDHIAEPAGLARVQSFLDHLHTSGDIAGYQLLKNTGKPDRTQRLPFQALIEFHDNTQFTATFAAQAAHGIHTGLHGHMLEVVSDLQVEVFEQLTAVSAVANSTPERSGYYACEV